jgi:hypothetical protein
VFINSYHNLGYAKAACEHVFAEAWFGDENIPAGAANAILCTIHENLDAD